MVQYGVEDNYKPKRKNDSAERAGFGVRLGAYLIDYALLSTIGGIVGFVAAFVIGFGVAFTNPEITEAELEMLSLQIQCVLILVLFPVQLAYYAWLPVRWDGQTIGKRLLNIRMVRTDGSEITFGNMFVRNIVGYFISGLAFGLGFLWAAWDQDNETWHDKLANTAVIQD